MIDDHSRKLLACPVKPDESSQSASDAMALALEAAQREGHAIDTRPTLLTDNGAGFAGEVMEKYLRARGVRHIFAAPYHPQTQGKVERFNRTLKEKINLWVYGTPEDLQAAITRMVEAYNDTPHGALKNGKPNDVYAGRKDECWNGGPRSRSRRWLGVMRINGRGRQNRKLIQAKNSRNR